jgi:hypothetical protein
MNCNYPEHHSGGGGWGGPIAAIFAAMIGAVVLGPLLHWLLIALAFIGIGAVVSVALVARKRWLEYQALRQGQYQPQMQAQHQPWQLPAQQQQQPPAVEQGSGQHVHFHGMAPHEIAEVMRQLRGR